MNKVIFSLSCLIIFSWISYFIIIPIFFKKNEIILPDLTNLSTQEAIVLLDELNLEYNIIISDYGDSEVVLQTIPSANESVKEDSVIDLYITKIKEIVLPDFINIYYEDVVEDINEFCSDNNLELIVDYIVDNNKSCGIITSQSLTPNEVITDSKLIICVVIHDNLFIMPDLTFINMYDVFDILKEYDLKVIYIFIESDFISDMVIDQSIKPGSSVLKGNKNEIKIYVSK